MSCGTSADRSTAKSPLPFDGIEGESGVLEGHLGRRALQLPVHAKGPQTLALESDRLGEPGGEIADRGDVQLDGAGGRGRRGIVDGAVERQRQIGRLAAHAHRRAAAFQQRERALDRQSELHGLALVGQ